MRTTLNPPRRFRAALPYVVVLALGGIFYHVADKFDVDDSGGRIGPGAWPKLILVMMSLTALWGAVSATLAVDKPAAGENVGTDDDAALIQPPEIHPWLVWLAIATTLVYLMLLPRLGFFLATALYSFVLIHLGQYRRPLNAALLSVAISFAFLFVFMRVVYVALPVGLAPFDRLSYALMAAMGVH